MDLLHCTFFKQISNYYYKCVTIENNFVLLEIKMLVYGCLVFTDCLE